MSNPPIKGKTMNKTERLTRITAKFFSVTPDIAQTIVANAIRINNHTTNKGAILAEKTRILQRKNRHSV